MIKHRANDLESISKLLLSLLQLTLAALLEPLSLQDVALSLAISKLHLFATKLFISQLQ